LSTTGLPTCWPSRSSWTVWATASSAPGPGRRLSPCWPEMTSRSCCSTSGCPACPGSRRPSGCGRLTALGTPRSSSCRPTRAKSSRSSRRTGSGLSTICSSRSSRTSCGRRWRCSSICSVKASWCAHWSGGSANVRRPHCGTARRGSGNWPTICRPGSSTRSSWTPAGPVGSPTLAAGSSRCSV
jgi:hypothetical protein